MLGLDVLDRLLNRVLMPAAPRYEPVVSNVSFLREENERLQKELADSRARHSRASHHCNEMKKALQNAVLKTYDYDKLQESARAAAAFATEFERKYVAQNIKLKRVENSYLEACRAFAVVFGDSAEPAYDGETVMGSWPGFAAKKARTMRNQLQLVLAAWKPFEPYLNHVLRRADIGEDEPVLDAGMDHFGTHRLVILKRDIRKMRLALEETRQ